MFGVGSAVRKAVAVAGFWMVVSGLGAGCEEDQRYVYVEVNLGSLVAKRLQGGVAALTFIGGSDKDGIICGPNWSDVPSGLGDRKNCKDEWVEIDQSDGWSASWSLASQGRYDWVLVIVELFDVNGNILYRDFRNLTFRKGGDLPADSKWVLTLRHNALCDAPKALGEGIQCCNGGIWKKCGTGLSLEGVHFSGWCTDDQDHEDCVSLVDTQ